MKAVAVRRKSIRQIEKAVYDQGDRATAQLIGDNNGVEKAQYPQYEGGLRDGDHTTDYCPGD
jgi:hypothetical protein